MIPIARPSLPPLERYVELVRDVWESHMLSNFGKYARLLEEKAQRYLGNPYVRAVSSGDLGLVLGLAALDLPEGGEVIVPSFTFNSTVNAILWNRLKPVFADIDERTFNLAPAAVEEAITPATCAILGTHVFGNPCDADALRAIADARGLKLVFDAAHAYGTTYRGRKSGTLADVEVFSLSGTKVVTSAEGGLVALRTPALAERIEYLRAYGFKYDYESHFVGLNAKLSELNAALGTLSLDEIEAAVAHRQQLAAWYEERLSDLEPIAFQQVDARDRTTYKDFAVLCDVDRDGLTARLGSLGVQTKKYFLPAHTMRAFAKYARRPLPRTQSVYNRILCLPIFNEMTAEQVDQVCDMVSTFLRSRAGA